MPSNVSSVPDGGVVRAGSGDPRLTAHLREYLGNWPPAAPVEVAGHQGRLGPAWDGASVIGVVVVSPTGSVVSVPPDRAAPAALLATAPALLTEEFRLALADVLQVAPGKVSPWLPLRWTVEPAGLADAGEWVDSTRSGLPEWLRAFSGRVLVTFEAETGAYLAGVAAKPHTRFGRELAVGTEEAARGRGLGRRLVAQAARAILAEGAVPLYVHHPDNVASARVADAAGLPDAGWRILYVWA